MDKSSLKMPKMLHFDEFLKTWSLQSNSVTRQVSFNRTKIGGKCQNLKIQMRHFEQFSTNVTRVETNLRLWQDIFEYIWISLCPEKGHLKIACFDMTNVATLIKCSSQPTNSIINSDCFPMMSRMAMETSVAGGDSCSIYNWNWLLGRSLVSHIYLLSPFGKKSRKRWVDTAVTVA